MSDQPNIVLIVMDQLSAFAVGAYGCAEARTPNIDAVAARGVRFETAYTPCPVCMPARVAMWTGRYNHETGIEHNQPNALIPGDITPLGLTISRAGYRCAHFGKTHDAGSLRGFTLQDSWRGSAEVEEGYPPYGCCRLDDYTTPRAAAFLREQHDAPFLLVADLGNPHDICNWVGDHAGPREVEATDDLPPLPDNFEVDDWDTRPVPVRFNCCTNKRDAQRAGWSPAQYRHYLAAYHHYCFRADREVGRILDTVGDRDDTVVIITADHGEGMAQHGMVTKAGHFYEACTRVPLIVTGPGIAGGATAAAPLASLLDLHPTLADLADAQAPDNLRGRSLKPWIDDPSHADDGVPAISAWRGGDECISPARMLRTKRYKYTRFNHDGGEELYDLQNDPGETRNLKDDADALAHHHTLLKQHCDDVGDPFFETPAHVEPPRFAHEPRQCPQFSMP